MNFVRNTFPYVTRMYWYNDRDLTDGGIQVQNYGLLHRDLTAKPALAALAGVNGAGSTTPTTAGAAGAPVAVAAGDTDKSTTPPLKNRPAPPVRP